MGSTLRLVVGAPSRDGMPEPAVAASAARNWLEAYERRLSRFRADSETSALNRDRRRRVPASALLRSLVGASIWAADRSNGMVDPTLLPALRRSGYDRSLVGRGSVRLAEALAAAPPRKPAQPDPEAAWREFRVVNPQRAIERRPGLAIDPGAIGKGLAVDALAYQLHSYTRFAIDSGGDLRLGGTASDWTRYYVNVVDPLTGVPVHVLELSSGGVATSSLGGHVWRTPDGRYHHDLLDPATGEPAWTGLLSATALAPTALEADMLAKTALLSGPAGARKVLRAHGGVTIRERGTVELHGPLARNHGPVGVASA